MPSGCFLHPQAWKVSLERKRKPRTSQDRAPAAEGLPRTAQCPCVSLPASPAWHCAVYDKFCCHPGQQHQKAAVTGGFPFLQTPSSPPQCPAQPLSSAPPRLLRDCNNSSLCQQGIFLNVFLPAGRQAEASSVLPRQIPFFLLLLFFL